MKDLVIVSDPGVDDAVALALLDKMTPDIPKLLISSFGNVSESITSKNAQNLVNFLGPSWQFAKGSKLPLNKKIEHPWADYFHGPDGLWGVSPPKTKPAKQNPSHKFSYETVISLGPLTELIPLMSKYKVKDLILMGGVFNERGNETPYAEFNIVMDADAAYQLFETCVNTSVKIVPLDTTRLVNWSPGTVLSIPENNQQNKWLKKLLLAWFENYGHKKGRDFYLHDPLAVFLALRPGAIKWTKSGVIVVTDGEQRGRTVFEPANPVCEIALKIDNPEKLSQEIFNILFLD